MHLLSGTKGVVGRSACTFAKLAICYLSSNCKIPQNISSGLFPVTPCTARLEGKGESLGPPQDIKFKNVKEALKNCLLQQ